MAEDKGVVMDGRDIGTTVLPDAEVKIFMTASVKERALRRFNELSDEGISLEQLERDIAERDRLDQEREVSPLRCAEDAIILDTTHMDINQVVEAISFILRNLSGMGRNGHDLCFAERWSAVCSLFSTDLNLSAYITFLQKAAC